MVGKIEFAMTYDADAKGWQVDLPVRKMHNGQKVFVKHHGASEGSKDDGGAEKAAGKNNGNGKANSAKDGDGGGEEKKQDQKDEGNGGFEKKPADAPFTPEEDEKLKEMKGENKSWAEIIEVLGRNKSVLQAHWKEINKADGGNAGDAGKKNDGGDGGKKGGKKGGSGNENQNKKAGDDNKKDKNDKKKQEQEAAAEKKKQERAEKKAAAEKESAAPAPAPAAASVKAPASKARSTRSQGEAKFSYADMVTLKEDDMFSFDELQLLSELLMQDDRGRWLRIASRFFDKTGRRVAAEDVRDKFVELAKMGR